MPPANGRANVGPGTSGRAAHVVVVGNEKGGSGKTTVAMHLAIGLLRMGFRVGCIDLDYRQQSLAALRRQPRSLDRAHPGAVADAAPQRGGAVAGRGAQRQAEAEEQAAFDADLASQAAEADFVVVDCPGSDVPLARRAHTHADTLITPINDSLLDLDLLGRLDPLTWELKSAGVYASLVLDVRRERRRAHRSGIDWVVTRSRLSALTDRNKHKMAELLPGCSGCWASAWPRASASG